MVSELVTTRNSIWIGYRFCDRDVMVSHRRQLTQKKKNFI